jgi:7-cyano-7-deazaguanine reductase
VLGADFRMGTAMRQTKKPALTQLGHRAVLPANPAAAVIETVPNPHPDCDYVVRFTAPEFTCLCPVTGQPDFAHFVVDYCPKAKLAESKSFKLFLSSFRNHPAFHEDTTLMIAKRLIAVLKPKYIRVVGYWYPRGGIPIDVFFEKGTLPKNVWLPDLEVEPYRGRG